MKKNTFVSLIIVILISFIFQTTSYGDITKKYNFKDFSSVLVGWGMHLKVIQSNDYSIELKGDEEDIRNIKVDKSGEKLRFFVPKRHYRMNDEVYITISMPELTELGLSGGSIGDITMDVKSKSFDAGLSGGSSMKGKLNCGNINLSLSGGSIANISGKGNDITIEGSGGSIFKLRNFSVHNVDADLSGGSHVTIDMNGVLNTDQSGGSHLTYYGNARIGDTDFSGGSFVEQGD